LALAAVPLDHRSSDRPGLHGQHRADAGRPAEGIRRDPLPHRRGPCGLDPDDCLPDPEGLVRELLARLRRRPVDRSPHHHGRHRPRPDAGARPCRAEGDRLRPHLLSRQSRSRPSALAAGVRWIVLSIVAITLIIPMYTMIINAFKPQKEIIENPLLITPQ